MTSEDVRGALDHFVTDGKLIRYEVNGKSYLQDATVWETQHPQWAARSKYPAPEGWSDRVRTRENNEYVESGWDSVGGFGVQVNTPPEKDVRVPRVNGTNPYPYPQSQGQEPYIAQVRAARLESSESDIEDADYLEVDEVTGEVVEESPHEALIAEANTQLRRLFAENPTDTAGEAAG